MTKDLISRIIKPSVLQTNAYHVAAAEGLIKLDAMENPYVWPDDIKEQWLTALNNAELNRYPNADVSEVRKQLRQLLELPDDVDMMFGNGSDELIQIILLALNKASNVVMAPEPTFVMYRLLSELLELDFVGVPLKADFSLDQSAMLQAIEKHQPAVIFLAWPNNPTGNAFEQDAIEAIIKVAPGLVVIDEAYHVFAQKTFLTNISAYPNVLLMRTLSKLGLAGLRLGTLFGTTNWISELNKLRLPYNIGSLSQLSASFILENIDVLEQQAEYIREDRTELFNTLETINGVEAWPSEANFILFRVKEPGAEKVHQQLLGKKILIKKLHGSHSLLDNCLRVTVGTKKENELFVKNLKTILA